MTRREEGEEAVGARWVPPQDQSGARARCGGAGRRRGGPVPARREGAARPAQRAARAAPPALPAAAGAMEPSGGLFPSLVVVGHVVTLAAVWRWRKGRWRARDEQGKRGRRRPPPCRGAGGGPGRAARLPHPCISLFPPLPLPRVPRPHVVSRSPGAEPGLVAPSVWSPSPGSRGRGGRSGCRTGDWAVPGCSLRSKAPPRCQGQGALR